MKTHKVYVLAAQRGYEGSFYQKLFLIALALALLVAFLPATHALAAPASSQGVPQDHNLDEEWSNKLLHLRYEGLWYDRVRFYPADFDDPSDLSRVHYYLEQYGIALRAANTVVLNHNGFDIKGNVLNPNQADQAVHDLAMYLQMMRGFREKIAEIPGGR
jgi:hypothetical protein